MLSFKYRKSPVIAIGVALLLVVLGACATSLPVSETTPLFKDSSSWQIEDASKTAFSKIIWQKSLYKPRREAFWGVASSELAISNGQLAYFVDNTDTENQLHQLVSISLVDGKEL